MKNLGSILFILFVLFFAIVPFFIMFLISEFLYLIIGRTLKYRRKVIEGNVRKCFPQKTDQDVDRFITKVYRNITDIMVESIKSFTMTASQVRRRHKLTNPELLDKYHKEGRSVIAVTGHFGNWEWGSLSASLQTEYDSIVAFYKPIQNKLLNNFMKWSRSKFGTKLVSIYETSKVFDDHKNTPTVYLMAADQSPSNHKRAFWVDFMGFETAFIHGPEKHARKNDYALVFVEVMRTRRGYYEVTLSELSDNPLSLEPEKLTQIYANSMEKMILKKPECWLWSHRRWKATKDEIALEIEEDRAKGITY